MFSNDFKKVTLKGALSDYINRGAKWLKLSDIEGKYEIGEMPIAGWIIRKNDFAKPEATGIDKYNIYLVIDKEEPMIVRLPHSLGVRLVNDYDTYLEDLITYNPEEAFEDYLDNASIKQVKVFTTKFGSKSSSYSIY